MLKQHLAGCESGLVFVSKPRTPLRDKAVLNRHFYPPLRQLNLEIDGKARVSSFSNVVSCAKRDAQLR
jgi:hypothetical protein